MSLSSPGTTFSCLSACPLHPNSSTGDSSCWPLYARCCAKQPNEERHPHIDRCSSPHIIFICLEDCTVRGVLLLFTDATYRKHRRKVHVRSNLASATATTASGAGLDRAVAGEPATFEIFARDAWLNTDFNVRGEVIAWCHIVFRGKSLHP